MSIYEENLKVEKELLSAIEKNKGKILELKESNEGWFGGEDRFYRFYHQSFKIFDLQAYTEDMVDLFKGLLGYELEDLNKYFVEIYKEGTGKEFNVDMNVRWTKETRPIVEAYFHAKEILNLMIKYGLESDERNREGNAGWFAVLYLYNIR